METYNADLRGVVFEKLHLDRCVYFGGIIQEGFMQPAFIQILTVHTLEDNGKHKGIL